MADRRPRRCSRLACWNFGFADARSPKSSGEAKFGRVVAANGTEVLIAVDVGDEDSDATLKLNVTDINRGGAVRLQSFKLVLP